jgi:hypothetical protein
MKLSEIGTVRLEDFGIMGCGDFEMKLFNCLIIQIAIMSKDLKII